MNNLDYQVVTKVNASAKRISIKIKSHEEIEIIIPSTRYEKKATEFFEEKKIWIENQLIRLNTLVEKFEVKVGSIIPIWGQKFHIKSQDCEKLYITESELTIPSKFSSLVKLEVRQFLKKELKNYLNQKVPYFAQLMNLEYKKFSVKDTKSRWGSCSSNGDLTFAYRLIHMNKDVVDYVIIHELAHLKHMDHSKEFWSLVEQYCKNYKHIRNSLKRAPLVSF